MRKLFNIMMCLIIIGTSICSCSVSAAEDNIIIDSADDLIKLADNCTLDSWSEGKTVILKKDINVAKSNFKGIPSFSGTFDGNNHTISGISIKKDGSYLGLFRYLKNGATVKNLTVAASINPGDSASKLGIIVGSNEGSIYNCSVKAEISGKSHIGGIAGVNAYTGVISNSEVKGNVHGEHYIGGIAGQNFGTILNCRNKAKINISASDIKLSIQDINFEKINSTENFSDVTDVGGIAGFSSGIIQSCENSATVGYKHFGYNIGGITGRQSGYLNGCINHGKIYGRKDVGGIAGQLEPFTALKYSEKSIDNLSGELKKLQRLLNNTLNSTNYTKNSLSSKFKEINGYADDAIDSIDVLSEKTKDILNSDIESVNDTGAKITKSLADMADAFDDMDTLADNLELFTDEFKEITSIVNDSADDIDTTNLTKSLDELSKAAKKLRIASTQLSNAIRNMRDSISDIKDVIDAAKKVTDAINDVKSALNGAGAALGKSGAALKNIAASLKDGQSEEVSKYYYELSQNLTDFGESLKDAASEMKNVSDAVEKLGKSAADADINGLISGASRMATAFFNIGNSMTNLDNALKFLKTAVMDIDTDKLKDIAGRTDASVDYLHNAVTSLKNMSDKISLSMHELSDSPIITLYPIDDEYISAADNVSEVMTKISKSFDSLNGLMSSNFGLIINDLQAVSDQIFAVTDVLVDAVEDAYNFDLKDDLSNRFSDISEEDTKLQTTGKISECTNDGVVDGDVNVGGITGLMAIEYDFDPEDDIANGQKRTSDLMFTTRAVIRECANNGDICAKKNCVGGIVGKMNLGCVLLSNGCGTITSSTGSYAGGIAGYSDSVLKNNNAKCTLSAADYIGGIAGKGKHIYDCRSVVYIEDGNEKIGSIAGEITAESGRNIFCNTSYGGVDSISYAGIAEPVDIEVMKAQPNGDIFNTFTATFKIDDKTVGTVGYDYNGSISKSQIPILPTKSDSYGVWDTTDFKNLKRDIVVNAEYKPFITAVESKKTSKKSPVKVIAEGKYSENTSLKLSKAKNKYKSILYKTVDSYTVTINDCFNDNSKLHYLPSTGSSDKTAVYAVSGNKHQKLKTVQDGRYIVFDMNGNEMTFTAVQPNLMYYQVKAVAVLLICMIIIRLIYLLLKKKLIKN